MMLLTPPERSESIDIWRKWEARLLSFDQADPSVVEELVRTRDCIEVLRNLVPESTS